MTAGRPTLYDPAFIQKVDEYLLLNQDIWTEFHKTRGEKSDTYERVVQVRLPSREGFASFIGVSVDALADWETQYDEFSGALRKIDEEQLSRLTNEGLSGNYNPVIAKLLLSANHGKAEKTESKVAFSSADKIIDAIDAARKNGAK
jgi:hypothetical protein